MKSKKELQDENKKFKKALGVQAEETADLLEETRRRVKTRYEEAVAGAQKEYEEMIERASHLPQGTLRTNLEKTTKKMLEKMLKTLKSAKENFLQSLGQ